MNHFSALLHGTHAFSSIYVASRAKNQTINMSTTAHKEIKLDGHHWDGMKCRPVCPKLPFVTPMALLKVDACC